MKDTARMKAISDADMEKGAKSKKKKSSGFGVFINTLGMILLAIMIVIVGVNFSRDSRLMQKSKPASNVNTAATSATSDPTDQNYTEATVRNESDTQSTTEATRKSNNGKGTGITKKTEAVTPTVTPDP